MRNQYATKGLIGISKQNSIGSLGSKLSNQPQHQPLGPPQNTKRPSMNKDKEEIKRLQGIIAEKDTEIEKLKNIIKRQNAAKRPSMDKNKFKKIYKLFDCVQKDLEEHYIPE